MGIRTLLSYKDCCQFEANNCLPVTWLSLFSPQDFILETQQEDGEEYKVAIFRTSRDEALRQADHAITILNGHTPTWSYLHPIEILKTELISCPSEGTIELDLTQFWQINEDYQQIVTASVTDFQKMVSMCSGNGNYDIPILTQLVNKYSLGKIPSIGELSAEDCMYLFFGTYWGDPEREELYSMDYFGDDYWKNGS